MSDHDIAAIRGRLAGVEPRYRLSSAIGQVCKIGSPAYGTMVNQVNSLRWRPAEARADAQFIAAEFSRETCLLRLQQVTAILAAVEGFELNDEWERPGDVIPALAVYRDELESLTGPATEEN